MDNIIFEKIWQDDNLIELKISASSEFATAYQSCYIQDERLDEIADRICGYAESYNEACYLEFGKKEGNYTPAFSMCILPADVFGHIKIEVDIEIADNDTRVHRCCFYVESELGLVERLGKNLKRLITEPEGCEVSLGSFIKNKIVKPTIIFEEYIPLKVLIDSNDEPVKYLSYSKGTTSLLEIGIGEASGFIKEITLVLSKEYAINNSELSIDTYKTGSLKVNAEMQNNCSYFKTFLYENGVRIVISEERALGYVRMDRLYIGLSNMDSIVEICICELTPDEVAHIKNELDYQ